MADSTRPLLVGCAALVGEVRHVLARLGVADAVDTHWLPANLHNRPERIVDELRQPVQAALAAGRPVFVAYADCGTGGGLDSWLQTLPGVQRLPGAHCYEFFAGSERFAQLADAELGTFYLTDFLAKHFEALVWQGLGLDRHPQLRDAYFGAYRRVVLLSQRPDPAITAAARAAAERLDLDFVEEVTGLEPFSQAVRVGLRASEPAAAGR